MLSVPQSKTRRRSVLVIAAASLVAFAIGVVPSRAVEKELRPDYQPAAFAIQGARIFVSAEQTIDEGTVVIRHGQIESVGPTEEVDIPADAEVVDGSGLTLYPGFIDLYKVVGVPRSVNRSGTGEGRKVPIKEFALPRLPIDNRRGLTPEYQVAHDLNLSSDLVSQRRRLGFTDLVAAPGGAIATGQSALVSLSGETRRESIVKSPLALHIHMRTPIEPPDPSGSRPSSTTAIYPRSLMGSVAHLRQAMLDAEYNHLAWQYYEQSGGPRPANDPSLRILFATRAQIIPAWWEADTRDEILRSLDLANEFGTTRVIVGAREAHRAIDALKENQASVILRVDFPREPEVPSESAYLKQNPEDRTAPLRILANRRAKWEERLASAGQLAEAGIPFAFSSEGLDKADQFHAQILKLIEHGLSPEQAVDALTRRAAEIAGLGNRLGTIEPGKIGHLVALSSQYGDPKAKVRYAFIDGLKFEYKPASPSTPKADAKKPATKPQEAKPDTPEKSKEPKPDSGKPKGEPSQEETLEDQPSKTPFVDIATELEEDREPTIQTGGDVFIKDATILTVSLAGNIPRGSILVQDGKIAAIGPDLEAPEGVTVIDAQGLVAMPGMIDTHSHMAISSGVNESTDSIVPEVRVKDVVNGDDPTIYRALAGGTTTARLLHGSANTIGGQDAVIKLKPGQAGRDLILHDDQRPQGVKFALGENVVRRTERFPNTRMGVEATIERAFLEGQAYAQAKKAHEEAQARGEAVPPFRRDLRLEALAQIVDGTIKIHSHCYRSDEILMLLQVAERFGIRVQSLQHVLEGYKVAAEIAAHGAAASTFSDWWAYKIEAYDAIPSNASLMTEAGVSTSIKSDSNEVVRHLNLEAAKMIRYGGASEQEALAMVTINPARELGLDHRLGSIEVGKDADIVLFNAHPLDSFARCQLSLIDGEVEFQRQEPDEKLDTRDDDGQLHLADARDLSRALEIEPNPDGIYAIVGANLHPVNGPEIQNGTLIIAEGRIQALGGPETAVPDEARVIEANGLDVWPGLIDAGSQLGLFEIRSLPETLDYEESATFQPEVRASVALHPDSEILPVTRANGILTAFIQPTGGTIAGQGCLIDFDGWVPREMVQRDLLALCVNIPTYRRPSLGSSLASIRSANERRARLLDEIEEQFHRALEYDRVTQAAQEGQAVAPVPDPRMEALVPYAKGEKPVVFQANRDQEILDALAIARNLELKAIISGGLEAWKVADALKSADVPVVVGGSLRLPLEATDPYDAPYANAAKLHEAGVRFAIQSHTLGATQATSARNLPFEAATAAAFGLPDDEALKAVTLYPAEILGVADDLGSLEVGKRANLVLSAGHILQAATPVKYLFIGGKPIKPENRQTRLFDRYLERLRQVREGLAPLGLDRENEATPAARSSAPLLSPVPAGLVPSR